MGKGEERKEREMRGKSGGSEMRGPQELVNTTHVRNPEKYPA